MIPDSSMAMVHLATYPNPTELGNSNKEVCQFTLPSGSGSNGNPGTLETRRDFFFNNMQVATFLALYKLSFIIAAH